MMDRDELERIYDEHASCAFALFRRFTSSDADARDLLQDWLVKIARGIDSMEGLDNERSYLLRIAYRHAVDWSRRVGARKKYTDRAGEDPGLPLFTPESNPDRELLRTELEKSLVNLPEDQQMTVQLKLWEGLTFLEIGEVLGISANTAASRYRYGISRLREALRPIYDELYT